MQGVGDTDPEILRPIGELVVELVDADDDRQDSKADAKKHKRGAGSVGCCCVEQGVANKL